MVFREVIMAFVHLLKHQRIILSYVDEVIIQ